MTSGLLPPLRASWLGTVPYTEALALQRDLLELRRDCELPDLLLLLEHPHVYTLGRRGVLDHVLADSDRLTELGAEVVETDRGGEATYHGPGQLVAYPILSIREAHLGPVAYVRLLEQAIIDTLRQWRVAGHRVVGRTGVWVGGEPGARPAQGANPDGRKIAAVGVRVSAGVAMHGFALNVSTDLSYFNNVIPCGMAGLDVASIESLTTAVPSVREVGEAASTHLASILGRRLDWVSATQIAA